MVKPREYLPLKWRYCSEIHLNSQEGEEHYAGGLHHHRQMLDMEKGQLNKDRISAWEMQMSLFL